MKQFLIASLAVLAGVVPMMAHHSVAAMYDDKKAVNLKGVVTSYEWGNPHVYISMEVNGVAWNVELPSRVELRRVGWTRDTVKVPDTITVDAISARDGSKKGWGRSVTLANGKKMTAITTTAVPVTKSNKPVPKGPDGHPRLGVEPGQMGYWANPSQTSMFDQAANVKFDSEGILANIGDAGKVAPFLPWAKDLYEYRQKNLLKDDPMQSCLPPGGPRQFQVPFGVQFIEQPDRKRIFVFSGGANRNWREIDTDGRPLPTADDGVANYFGNSTAHWEGDTLVVESTGYNERFWMSNGGLPHTDTLKLTEKITRPNYDTLRYEVTVNDPATYSRPWTSSWTLQWVPGLDPEEYYCDDNNKDGESPAAK